MRTIISASRRTDLPAHYYEWLRDALARGQADVTQPFTGRVHTVSLRDEEVHTLVLWSKNYANVLRDLAFWADRSLYFGFTINDCATLEPGLPPLDARVAQLRALAAAFGPQRINWRFDPVVSWSVIAHRMKATSGEHVSGGDSCGNRRDNLGGFQRLADAVAEAGVRRCTFSFMCHYRKVTKRGERLGIAFHDPPSERKREIAAHLAAECQARGMVLLNCCNEGLEGIDNLERGRCIDGALLAQLAGEPCSLAPDKSQRPHCGCTVSRDIGSYSMTCPHACWYCYANPKV